MTQAARAGRVRYLEDFNVGEVFDLGSYRVTEAEVVAFARAFDPQLFHLDAARAERSPFGGLIASGWHTASVFMRLYVDGLLADTACMGSPGVDQLRWLSPVRPNDVLTARATVLRIERSSTHLDRGTLDPLCELLAPDDSPVMTMTLRTLVRSRGHGP